MLRFRNILSFFFVFLSFSLYSQNNIIKAGLSDALLGYFNLSYERVVGKKNSIVIKGGYMEPTKSPFISEKALTPEAYTFDGSEGGIDISVEYRIFTGKEKALLGFYISPYLRYLNQSLAYFDEIDNRSFNVAAGLNTLGIGAQLGYQVIISSLLSLDFYFFGAGIDYHTLNLKYRLVQPESGFDYNSVADDINEVFRDINYLEKRLEHTVNNDNLTTKLPFFFPGFRIGAGLGFAF
jgi:hypothetical protein